MTTLRTLLSTLALLIGLPACESDLPETPPAGLTELEAQAIFDVLNIPSGDAKNPSPRASSDDWMIYIPVGMSINEFAKQIQADCKITNLGIQTASGKTNPVDGIHSLAYSFATTLDLATRTCVWDRMKKQGGINLCHANNKCPDGEVCNAVTKHCE